MKRKFKDISAQMYDTRSVYEPNKHIIFDINGVQVRVDLMTEDLHDFAQFLTDLSQDAWEFYADHKNEKADK